MAFFQQRRIAVRVRDIAQNPEAWTEFEALGCVGTPALLIDGEKFVGFDEHQILERLGDAADGRAGGRMDKLWYLSQINLFEALPMADLREIDHMAPMSTIKKGSLIIDPTAENRNLYLLKRGRVRLFKMSEDGKQLTLGLLGKGNIFGETESLSTGLGSAYVEALDDSLVCILGKADFEAILLKWPQVALKMVTILTERIREAEELVENLAFHDLRYRVIYLLTKLAHQFGSRDEIGTPGYTQLDLNLSHHDLAQMIGSTRESVSLVLSHLAKEGLVVTGRKAVAVDLPRATALIDKV